MKEEKRRASKFRNVFGKGAVRKTETYEGFRVSKHQTESCPLAVNPKWMAVSIQSEGGGSFVTVPIWQPGRIDHSRLTPFTGHAKPICEMVWNPFDDDVIATGSDDATVRVWLTSGTGTDIPDGKDPLLLTLRNHERKISCLSWHPAASNVLATGSCDTKAIVWNVETGQAIRTIKDHEDSVWNVCWNYDGSQLATTCKDKMLRIVDPRKGSVVSEVRSHQGVKGSKAFFVDRDPDGHRLNYMISTGFSRMSERQIAVWDQRNFKEPLSLEIIDSAPGALFPFFDQDTGMLYVGGKGDGNIRFYEFRLDPDTASYLSHLGVYQTSIPQTGLCCMPKRGLDTSQCEIFRFYKLRSTGTSANGVPVVEPVSMIVPRKSDLYQDDLYPPTAGPRPALQAQEWIAGKNCNPLLVSLKNFAGIFTEEPPPKPGQRPLSQLSVLKSKFIMRGEAHNGPPSCDAPSSARINEISAKFVTGQGATKHFKSDSFPARDSVQDRKENNRSSAIKDHNFWGPEDASRPAKIYIPRSSREKLLNVVRRRSVEREVKKDSKEGSTSEFEEYLMHAENHNPQKMVRRLKRATQPILPTEVAASKPPLLPSSFLPHKAPSQGTETSKAFHPESCGQKVQEALRRTTVPPSINNIKEETLAKPMRGILTSNASLGRETSNRGSQGSSSPPPSSCSRSDDLSGESGTPEETISPAISGLLDNVRGNGSDRQRYVENFDVDDTARLYYAETVSMCNELREENKNNRMELNYKNRRIVELENEVAEKNRRIKELEMELGLDKLYATLRGPKSRAPLSGGSNPGPNLFLDFKISEPASARFKIPTFRGTSFHASRQNGDEPNVTVDNNNNNSNHRFIIPPLRKAYTQIR